MKKVITLILIIMWTTIFEVRSQNSNLEVLPFKDMGHYGINIADIHDLMQQRNGEIIVDLYSAYSDDPHGYDAEILGHLVYKLTTSLNFVDSLFIPDSLAPEYLYAKDPRGEGNIRVGLELDGNGNTLLRISHFDDDYLDIDVGQDIVAPFCEGEVYDYPFSYLFDSQNNIILKYYKEIGADVYEGHIARYNVQGELINEALIPENQNFITTMEVFKESPLEYIQWRKGGGGHLNLFVIDSLFQLKNTYVVNKMLFEDPQNDIQEYFNFTSSNSNSTFVIPDGEDILVAAYYTRQDHWALTECGVAAGRYNLRTMQRKALAQFNDYPGYAQAKCYGFKKLRDGSTYLLYREEGMPVKYWMTVVKMDADLNVEWKRYCETPDGMTLATPYGTALSEMIEDEEGNEIGFVVAGWSTFEGVPEEGFFFAILTHDGIPASVKEGIEVRPYMFYPNPTQDQLRLQYSPDVQPKQIELYDLQGRLVRSQGSAFESFDMGQLPTGTYTMRVIMDDGQVFTDKVVKE